MSLIFQTLGKLDADKTGLDSKEEPVASRSEVAKSQPVGGGFRRVLWLSGGVALVLVILGFGVVWAIHSISSHEKINTVYAANATSKVDAPFRPIAPADEKNSSAISTPRFVPPDFYDSDALPGQVAADEAIISTGSTTEPFVPSNGNISNNGQRVERQHDDVPLKPAHVDPKNDLVSAVSHAPENSQKKNVAEQQVQPFSTSDPLTQEQRQIQAAQRIARRKSERIGHIVEKLEAALSQMPGDAAQIEALLKNLAKAKGENNTYVAKMRAFWLLKQEKYEQAEAILKMISAKSGADPEVGINLAIIDLHKGNRSDAIQRLSKLRKTHPDNMYIADLLRKIR